MKTITEQATENGRLTVEEIVNRDKTFRYMLLSRLQSDCDYYLHYGGRYPKVLWAGDETRQKMSAYPLKIFLLLLLLL